MKLTPKSIAEGKCYLTKDGDLRQVVSTEPAGMVTYETRKKTSAGKWSAPQRFSETLDHFVRKAISETPCP
jgi:hypothetical protein